MAGKEKRFIKIHSESLGSNSILLDTVTGVNYFYHSDGYSGGLTVLVDKDGKPIVTPVEE